MSWKNQTPSTDPNTPRTADEIMCVIGEVILMERRLAMPMRKPMTPCASLESSTSYPRIYGRTVIAEPQMNVENTSGVLTVNSLTTSGHSPAKKTTKINMPELSRFVYQLRSRALPPRNAIAFLMTTACTAVTALLATPKKTPVRETATPSRNTPTKKPSVTMLQATRMKREGREERKR